MFFLKNHRLPVNTIVILSKDELERYFGKAEDNENIELQVRLALEQKAQEL